MKHPSAVRIRALSSLLAAAALATAFAAAADDDDAAPDPVERYLKFALDQIDRVESARYVNSGRPLDLTEFNDAYTAAMAAAGDEAIEKDLFAHHRKALDCMSDRREPGDPGLSLYQLRAQCKAQLGDISLTLQQDARDLQAQHAAAARAQSQAQAAAQAPGTPPAPPQPSAPPPQ